jgi:hypothetical protein
MVQRGTAMARSSPFVAGCAISDGWSVPQTQPALIRPTACRTYETIAARMLARDGVGVIWRLHLRAAASYRGGNCLSAAALIGIADNAERLWHRST